MPLSSLQPASRAKLRAKTRPILTVSCLSCSASAASSFRPIRAGAEERGRDAGALGQGWT